MRHRTIKSSWLRLHPHGRLDAKFWLDVMDEVKRRGIPPDEAALHEVKAVIAFVEWRRKARMRTQPINRMYRGMRTQAGIVVEVYEQETWRALPLRLDLFRHSPDGFEWGYGGSGPAQLALAILADFTKNDAKAVKYHQAFKLSVIGNLNRDGWTLLPEQIEEALFDIDAARDPS